MDWFDDDPFEDIFREFLGHSGNERFKQHNSENMIRGENDERNIDFIETSKDLFLVFELPGYNEHDVSASIAENALKIVASKKECDVEKVADYLTRKLCRGISIKKILPRFVDLKSMKYTMRNGILEVVFEKK